MGKSYRKFGITSPSSASDKPHKKMANRAFRARCKEISRFMVKTLDFDQHYPKLKEISDVYCFTKDGYTLTNDKEHFRK